jgi:hypothetical protein
MVPARIGWVHNPVAPVVLRLDGVTSECERVMKSIMPATFAAIKRLEEAAEVRHENRAELVKSMVEIIRQCKTLDELVEQWPEAGELRSALFPDAPSAGSLAVVTPEKRAALCRNMASRGIDTSAVPMCGITVQDATGQPGLGA